MENTEDIFATTRWTVVLAAQGKDSPAAQVAMSQLCQTYWFPLYAYVRRRGYGKEDAEDLTQSFFVRFLASEALKPVAAGRGKFRAYLLACLQHFLANEWDKARAVKRGGGAAHLSLDWQSADSQFQIAAHGLTPEQAFDREWAIALLERVLENLRVENEVTGKTEQFHQLKIYLTADRAALPQAELAEALGMDGSALRVALHRLRKRYRELLRREILHTLSDPAQLDEELRTLFSAFGK